MQLSCLKIWFGLGSEMEDAGRAVEKVVGNLEAPGWDWEGRSVLLQPRVLGWHCVPVLKQPALAQPQLCWYRQQNKRNGKSKELQGRLSAAFKPP